MTKYLYILMCLTLPLAVHAANLSVQEDGGGDYQTLDEACDNIGAGETITIEGEWDNPDTRSVIVSTDCTITATGSARVTTASHVSGTPKHYRLHVSDGEHAITVNDSETTIDGIEIKQAGSGSSDECIRFAHEGGSLTTSLFDGRTYVTSLTQRWIFLMASAISCMSSSSPSKAYCLRGA